MRGAAMLIMTPALVSGCVPSPSSPRTELEPIRNASSMADAQVFAGYIRAPRPDRFSICHEHTCGEITEISLSAGQWAVVRQEFSETAPDPAAERRQIAAAVARLERLVASQAGTGADQARNFPGLGQAGQMDCVDEATNTSAYLIMLQQDGLLHWHQAGPRLSRGVLQLSAPHFTATIDEPATGARFAVDSWFEANGRRPHIVPIETWLRGWQPPGKTVESHHDRSRHKMEPIR